MRYSSEGKFSLLTPLPFDNPQILLIIAIRGAYYVPLPFFSVAQPKSQTVLDLFMPVEFGEFSGAWRSE